MLTAYNILVDVGDVAFAVAVLIFLPLALFRSKRKLSGQGLKLASLIFFLNLWAYTLGAIWHYWGLVAVVIGVIFTPIVSSVVALAALTLHKDWWAVLSTVAQIAITFAAYMAGDKLQEKG